MSNALTTVNGAPLSRIGLGTAAFGTGNKGDDLAGATFRRALDLGLNWIDTDAIFGLGGAERLLGQMLSTLSPDNRPFIATAVGFDWDGRSRRATRLPTMEPRRLRQQMERSLRRLGVSAVDLVKLHIDTSDDALFEEAWSTLLDFKQGGLARSVGLIAPDSAQLERAERIGSCDAVYVELSLIDRRVGDSELLWRRANTPVVIAYHTLAGGELMSSHRRKEQDDELPSIEPLRHLLLTIGSRRRAAPSAIAAAWSLMWPGVASVVVGARNPEQIAATAAAPEIELSVRDLSDVANLLTTLGAEQGPLHPRRFTKAA